MNLAVAPHQLAGPVVFVAVGSFHCAIAVMSMRKGEITIGRRTARTIARTDQPFGFWGYCLWFLLGGTFFFGLGVAGLIDVLG